MPFSSPPNPKEYAEQVYAIVVTIPPGKVMTYGQIALLIPPPFGIAPDVYVKLSPRWVGGVMAHAPDNVPWQRVINSQGKISERPGMGPLAQRQLLEREGVVFDERGRVNLAKYQWKQSLETGEQPTLF
jgi:methylated-DNA-protein-cysteine methyltransferase related protein